MKVNLDRSQQWQVIDIAKVEQAYNCKFVAELPLRINDIWRDESSLIFYTANAHPKGSNYLAISRSWHASGNDLVVSDGISAVEGTIAAVVDGDEIYYSRFRHDYRSTPSGHFIDGGRDYVRTNSSLVSLAVTADSLTLVTTPEIDNG